MHALILVLNKVDELEDVLAAMMTAGVKGATILDSQGNAVAAISLADIAESNENYLQMANDLKAAAAEISKIVAYTQN